MRTARAAVVVMALGVRLLGLDYSVPFHFHVDEQLMLTTTFDLAGSPRRAVEHKYFFNYGSLPRTLLLPPLVVAKATGRLDLTRPRQITAFYLLARGTSAVWGAATVALTMRVAARVAGPGAGLIAGLALAFSPLHVRDSHFFTVDVPLTFLVLATAAAAARLATRPSWGTAVLAGLCAGLGLATKVSSGPAMVALGVVLSREVRSKHLGVAALAMVASFVAGNWPIFVGPGRFVEGLAHYLPWVAGAQVRQPDLHFLGTAPWLYWIRNLLWYGAGPVMTTWGILGASLPAVRRDPSGRMLLVAGLSYFAVAGAMFQKFMRFSLPLHPLLAVGMGAWWAWAWRRTWARPLAGASLVVHLAWGLAYAQVFWHQDPRLQAGEDLRRDLPRGTRILLETTHSNPPLIEDDFRKGLFGSYLPRLGECLVTREGDLRLFYIDPYVYLYQVARDEQERVGCLRRGLDSVDVVVIGPRYRDQYLPLASRFPAMAGFYRGLDQGTWGFTLVRTYDNPARIFGFVIPDARSELTFREFDRPVLRVYARRGSPAQEVLCPPRASRSR